MTIEGRTVGEIDFKKLVESCGHVVKLCASDGTLLYANPAFERVYGHPVSESIGRMNVNEYIHPDDIEGVAKETQRAVEETSPNGAARSWAVYRFRCADGDYKKMWSIGTYLLDEPGIKGVVINTTEFVE